MKTKEFIKIMEDAGFEVWVNNFSISVVKREGGVSHLIATVGKFTRYKVNTSFVAFEQMDSEPKQFVALNAFKYAVTKIEDRENIELNKYERMILESLHRDYRTLSINSIGFIQVSDESFKHRNLDMFEELFQWVEEGKTYLIKDLLNAK